MKASVQRLYDRHYPTGPDGVRRGDGSRYFYEWIRSTPGLAEMQVLNIGAGPTPDPPLRRLRGQVKWLVGVDVDPIVMTNEDLDEAHVTGGIELPFGDAEFDLVYSDWTVEHVAQPLPFLQEVLRVLKPGGQYLFRTTNRGHYVTAISAHTPYWFHRLVANRVRDLRTEDHEPWPTYYRLNTERAVRRELAAVGFERVEVQLIEPYPVYLVFHPLAFRVGIAYERVVTRFSWAARLRLILIARGRKGQGLAGIAGAESGSV